MDNQDKTRLYVNAIKIRLLNDCTLSEIEKIYKELADKRRVINVKN